MGTTARQVENAVNLIITGAMTETDDIEMVLAAVQRAHDDWEDYIPDLADKEPAT